MSDTFVCESCGRGFAKARSDAEAEAEYQVLWTEQERTGAKSTLCDDCFQEFALWLDRFLGIELQP